PHVPAFSTLSLGGPAVRLSGWVGQQRGPMSPGVRSRGSWRQLSSRSVSLTPRPPSPRGQGRQGAHHQRRGDVVASGARATTGGWSLHQAEGSAELLELAGLQGADAGLEHLLGPGREGRVVALDLAIAEQLTVVVRGALAGRAFGRLGHRDGLALLRPG